MGRKKNKTATYMLWKASKNRNSYVSKCGYAKKKKRRKFLNNHFKCCKKEWNFKNLHNQAQKKNNTLS